MNAIETRPDIDATKKLPGEPRSFQGWPLLIKMDEAVKAQVEKLFGTVASRAANPE